MSDIVWVALFGVAGTVLVAIVSGYITYRVTKSQSNTRSDELRLQLAYQEQEAQRDRLVEARKGYLIPIREVMSEWMQGSNAVVMAIARVQAAKVGDNSKRYKEEVENFNLTSERIQQSSSKLETLRGQISDRTLQEEIGTAQKAQEALSPAILKLTRLFNDATASTKLIETALVEFNSIRDQLRAKLIDVNKRVEELMTGESSL